MSSITLPSQISGHIKDIVRVVRKYLPRESHSILLYGSWARGDALPQSDIDIAISGPSEVEGLTLAQIREEIEELPTLRNVDIVDLPGVGEPLRRAVLEENIRLD